jgi:anti-anti-sigma factor
MDKSFSLKSEQVEQAAVIRTLGYLNHTGGESVAQECTRYLDRGITTLILDLTESKMVNSIGISILIEVIEKLNERQGRLVFTGLDPAVEKTFTIMGLFEYAGKFPTTEDALRELRLSA